MSRFLGIDYGEKRIGLSYGDELGIATPLPAAIAPKKVQRLEQIGRLITERRITDLVIGYPLNMNGSVGFKAQEVDAFITLLEKRFALPVHRIDERLTSKTAGQTMSLKELRKTRASGILDSRAATILLQDYLDAQSLRLQRP
ncbi:MAG: Holliday junction resolvase RuvX [Puniceicoccaceae bacterium]